MTYCKWVTAKKFSELTGYTIKAVEHKMDDGVWRQGKIWIKAPDNRRLINLKEYDLWVESQVRI